MDQTPLAELASLKLGEPVGDYIRRRRAERKTSLRDVADYIHEATGIRVSAQTVLNWAPDAVPAARASDDVPVADAG